MGTPVFLICIGLESKEIMVLILFYTFEINGSKLTLCNEIRSFCLKLAFERAHQSTVDSRLDNRVEHFLTAWHSFWPERLDFKMVGF